MTHVSLPAPSTSLTVSVKGLIEGSQMVSAEMARVDMPFGQRSAVSAILVGQVAIVERLDALLTLVEHAVVDHLCDPKVKGKEEDGPGGQIDNLIGGL